jgi:hypothetical protein
VIKVADATVVAKIATAADTITNFFINFPFES